MDWRDRVFKNFRLYAVTDLKKSDPSFLKKAEAAYRGGADIIQLRSKSLSHSEKLAAGKALRKVASRLKKLYFVNDDPALAFLTDADGLHVGQDDLPPKEVRRMFRKLNKRIYLGLSTHSFSQAEAAIKEPVDYFAVGPVFSTPTKPDYKAVGLRLVRSVSGLSSKLPWLAIGSINEMNLNEVLSSGAERVAVVRAVFGAADVKAAAFNLVQKMKGFSHVRN